MYKMAFLKYYLPLNPQKCIFVYINDFLPQEELLVITEEELNLSCHFGIISSSYYAKKFGRF